MFDPFLTSEFSSKREYIYKGTFLIIGKIMMS